MDTNRFAQTDTAQPGAEIFLVPVGAPDVTPLRATFEYPHGDTFYAAFAGSSTALPFPTSEWEIWTAKTYPLPDKSDLVQMVHNAILRGNMTFEALAEEILSLIAGDIAPGVEAYTPPMPEQEQEQVAPEDMPTAEATYDVVHPSPSGELPPELLVPPADENQ